MWRNLSNGYFGQWVLISHCNSAGSARLDLWMRWHRAIEYWPSHVLHGLQLSLFERSLGAEENNRRVRKAKLHLACLKSSFCPSFSIWKSRHYNHRYDAVRIARDRCWKTWFQGRALLLESVGPEHDLYFCYLSYRLRCLGDFKLGSKEGCLGCLAPESNTTFNRWPDSAY